ncbi:unnamed protein product, partial [Musa acuminata var. zebrina]
ICSIGSYNCLLELQDRSVINDGDLSRSLTVGDRSQLVVPIIGWGDPGVV